MVVVIIAAFLTWGSMEMTPSSDFNNFVSQMSKAFGGPDHATAVPFDGWHSRLAITGMNIPNWLVGLYAGVIVVATWLGASKRVVMFVAGVGALHTGTVSVISMGSKYAHPGIGSFIAFAAFALSFYFAFSERERS
jgi:hypothetical protein